jgi:hypothetical protein
MILQLIGSILMGWICLIGCCAGSVYASFNYNLFKIVTGALRSLMAPFGIKVPRSTTLEKILR